LALGVAEIKMGRAAEGRARLQGLEHDARAEAFLRIANRAGSLILERTVSNSARQFRTC